MPHVAARCRRAPAHHFYERGPPMRPSRSVFASFVVAAFAVALSCSALLAADEAKPAGSPAPAAAEEKAAPAKPKKAKAARLTKPWADMTSLTDEQKTQIAEIHRKAVEEK